MPLAWLAALGFAVLLAATLRIHGLADRSLWLDEIGQAVVAQASWPDFWNGIRSHAAAAPLDYLGERIALSMLGPGTAQARAWAVLCGIAAIPAIAWAAHELFKSRTASLVAAFLLAISPFHISYSQEGRFYALSVLVGILLIGTFSRLVTRGGLANVLAFSFVSALALHTHYFLAITLLFAGLAIAIVWVVGLREERPSVLRAGARYLIGVGAAGVMFLPWFVFAASRQATNSFPGSGPPVPTLENVADLLVDVISPPAAANFVTGQPGVLALALIVMAGIGLAAGSPRVRPDILSVGLTSVGLLPAMWLLVSRANYFLAARQLILLLPFLFVLAAGGIHFIVGGRSLRGRRRVRVSPLLAVSGLLLWGALQIPSVATVKAATWRNNEDWRGVAHYVAEGLCDGGRVFVNMSRSYAFGFGYYEPGLVTSAHEFRGTPGSVQTLDLGETDWVAVRTNHYWVGGREGLKQIHDTLVSRGYGARTFPALMVFAPVQTC
ncbi:MAG TPA: glycosyltransferase family 39 protein [Gemmatimonadales bacterium]|nr:glycosyltransferase family 39 protein [Gemmatimonadales bacterium]